MSEGFFLTSQGGLVNFERLLEKATGKAMIGIGFRGTFFDESALL